MVPADRENWQGWKPTRCMCDTVDERNPAPTLDVSNLVNNGINYVSAGVRISSINSSLHSFSKSMIFVWLSMCKIFWGVHHEYTSRDRHGISILYLTAAKSQGWFPWKGWHTKFICRNVHQRYCIFSRHTTQRSSVQRNYILYVYIIICNLMWSDLVLECNLMYNVVECNLCLCVHVSLYVCAVC